MCIPAGFGSVMVLFKVFQPNGATVYTGATVRTNSITLCVKNRLDGWLNWFFNVSIPAHLQLLRLTRLLLLGIMVLIRLQADWMLLVTS